MGASCLLQIAAQAPCIQQIYRGGHLQRETAAGATCSMCRTVIRKLGSGMSSPYFVFEICLDGVDVLELILLSTM